MSRINFVREMKQKNKLNSIERKREDGWNDRFYLGKISDYKPLTLNSNTTEELKPTKHIFKSSRGSTSANKINQSKPFISNDELVTDPYRKLQSLWDDLGVRSAYRAVFESIAKQLSGSLQLEFITYEINSLSKFAECLSKYAKEISNREKAIFLLQKLDQVLGQSLRDGTNAINESIIKDIIQTIHNLRVYSVNVVNQMNRIREMCSYSTASGKYDLDKLSNGYMFNRNYLIKMRFDLDFLSQTNLCLFFNFADSSDPFLHAVSHEDLANGKVAIPIGEEVYQSIHQCQYIIMQDIIFYQMQTQGKESNEQQPRHISPGHQVKEANVSFTVEKPSTERKMGKSCNGEAVTGTQKRNMKIERDCIPSVNKEDIVKRMEEYDVIQKHLEIDREMIGKRREDLCNEREFDEKLELQLKEERNEDKFIGRKESRKKESMKEKEIKKGKSIEREKEKEKEKQKEMEREKNQKENDMKKRKEEEEDEETNINWHNKKQKEIEKDIKAPRLEEETKLTHNISPKVSLQLPEEMPQTPHHQASPILSSHSHFSSSLRRSLTPKSRAKQLQSSLKLSYYTEDLDDFLPFYQRYYRNIPQDQRSIFNIKDNPLSSLATAFNPKIILCTNAKNRSDIKGLCLLSFDIEAEPSPKVNIIHLSSIKPNEEVILSTLIEYIKSTIYCSQIDIDLYYHYEEGKFTINKELRDLFKNTLGFRWAKLENLAQHIRYQKMYLKTCQENPIIDNYSLVIVKPLFTIKQFSIAAVAHDGRKEKASLGYEKYMNYFGIVYLVNWLKQQERYSIADSRFNWEITPKDIDKGHIKCSIGDSSQLKALLEDNEVNYVLPSDCGVDYLSQSFQLNPCFTSNLSGLIDGVYYNRLQGQIKTLKHKETNQLFYLIPTIDGSNSIILCQMNSSTKLALIDKGDNLYHLFNSFYHQIEPIKNSGDPVLWVPSFDITTHLATKRLECLEGLEILKDGKEVQLTAFDEYIKVQFDRDFNSLSSFTMKTKKEEVVIREPFLMGVINLNVLSSFEFSTILLLNVTKEHWRRKK